MLVLERERPSLPHHLGSLCSDRVLLNITRPVTLQQTLDYGIQDLLSQHYTDLTLLPSSGEGVRMHSLLLSAASPHLSSLLSTTFTPNLQYTICLPDYPRATLTSLSHLLYGSPVILSQSELTQLLSLVDVLNIRQAVQVTNYQREAERTETEGCLQLQAVPADTTQLQAVTAGTTQLQAVTAGTTQLQAVTAGTTQLQAVTAGTTQLQAVPDGNTQSATNHPTSVRCTELTGDCLSQQQQLQQHQQHVLQVQEEQQQHSCLYLTTADSCHSVQQLAWQDHQQLQQPQQLQQLQELEKQQLSEDIDLIRVKRFTPNYLQSGKNQPPSSALTSTVLPSGFLPKHVPTREAFSVNAPPERLLAENLQAGDFLTGVEYVDENPGGENIEKGHNPGTSMTSGHDPGTSMTPGHDPVASMTPGNDPGTSITPGHNPGTSMTPRLDPGIGMTPGHDPFTSITPGHDPGTSMTPGHDPGTRMTPTEREEEEEGGDRVTVAGMETVNTSDQQLAAGSEKQQQLPLCCWHCNQEFPTFRQLSDHSVQHQATARRKRTAAASQRRHHRCPRCGEVVSSMWRLRQHLVTHQTGKRNKKGGDHQYAERSRSTRSTRLHNRKQSGDHGYATAKCSTTSQSQDPNRSAQVREGMQQLQEEEVEDDGGADGAAHVDSGAPKRKSGGKMQKEVVSTLKSQLALNVGIGGNLPPSAVNGGKLESEAFYSGGKTSQQPTPLASVCSEHSYGTKRDSSPEPDMVEEKIDHPYSALKVKMDNRPCDNRVTSATHQNSLLQQNQPQHNLAANVPLSNLVTNRSQPNLAPNGSQPNLAPNGSQPNLAAKGALSTSGLSQPLVPRHPRGRKSRAKPAEPAVFPCGECEKVFPAAYRLNRHVREVHNKEKFHRCDLCTKEFFKSTSLIRHKVAVHASLKPYQCERCGASFKDLSGCQYHIRKEVCLRKQRV